ncbi:MULTISPECIES: alpha/beta fold hydrolase [unclassified Sphingopyxis]|jgi:pimeloyl-ACP methyl ester carboxylesterase|uniref:alpha/beta fold hydrolase n=1 Tax=unclassified Sphingopyxis TaxID=2614943 RepID=UPI0006C4DE8B|nr:MULTISPECIES: alpha/beta hydrolase [unclassified Sphingopyxis]USI77294.1 alpha/beta hydrolase [Sphingopyxis sp. USTB-05]GAO80235.1 N-formylglutamate deformylase [Sphingopyxis sp. C-1]
MNRVVRAALAAALTIGSAPVLAGEPAKAAVGFIEVDPAITLRHMVVHNPNPKGTVLLLHGFPETLYVWQDMSAALADDYEVHAFDWPGYGQSSRPAASEFAYAPRDYARVLKAYIAKAGIDRSKLTIYATDIGALPALLAALDDPDIARTIIVGDFAPFDRPQHMQERLQQLKSPETAEAARIQFNQARDEIFENSTRRGLAPEAQFGVPQAYQEDRRRGWGQGAMTSADAFYHYYSHFSRDQNDFEANIGRLKTPVKVMWGEKDVFINHALGAELAQRIGASFRLLPGIGHYPHLQDPQGAAGEVRSAFR